jgi:hypothetical protein
MAGSLRLLRKYVDQARRGALISRMDTYQARMDSHHEEMTAIMRLL